MVQLNRAYALHNIIFLTVKENVRADLLSNRKAKIVVMRLAAENDLLCAAGLGGGNAEKADLSRADHYGCVHFFLFDGDAEVAENHGKRFCDGGELSGHMCGHAVQIFFGKDDIGSHSAVAVNTETACVAAKLRQSHVTGGAMAAGI